MAVALAIAPRARAAVYFFDLGTLTPGHGSAINAAPADGAVGVYIDVPGTGLNSNEYISQSITFAEGTLEFSEVNGWSNSAEPPVGNDYWFTAPDGPADITVTLNLNDASGDTTATLEFWTGCPDRTQIVQTYAGVDASGSAYSVTTTNTDPGEEESVVTPTLGPGAVVTATSSENDLPHGDIRIAGVRITTTTVPGSGGAFVITDFNYEGGTRTATVTWASQAGRTYAIDVSGDLQSWLEISDEEIADSGSTTFTEVVPEGVLRRLYRVRDVTPAAP